MKKLWNSFKVAFAMFSKIPVPMADWTPDNMKYMFCFFPLIGAVIGALTLLAGYLLGLGQFHPVFSAAVLVMIPVLVTGGIHLDGLLDTSDAMSSWREREKRLEILKDSHAGAFAIIACCCYFAVYLGACSQITGNMRALGILGINYIVARCFSGLGVLTLPKASEKGTVAQFSRNSEEKPVRIVLAVLLVLMLVLMILIQPVYGIGSFAAAVLVFLNYRRFSMKYFGGTSGDLSGFFLCTCETASAVVLAVLCGLIR